MTTTERVPVTTCASQPPGRWPTTRILFALAGSMTLLGTLLAATVSSWWLLLPTLVGLNQLLFTAVGSCPASLVIDRLRDGRPAGTVSTSPKET